MDFDYRTVARFMIAAGLVLAAVGVVMLFAPKLGLFRLPGDINIRKDGFSFSFPVVSCIVISLILTALSWLFSHFGGGR